MDAVHNIDFVALLCISYSVSAATAISRARYEATQIEETGRQYYLGGELDRIYSIHCHIESRVLPSMTASDSPVN